MAGEAFWQTGATTTGTATTAGMPTREVSDAAPNAVYINSQQAVYDAESDTTFVAVLGEGRDCYATAYHHPTGDVTGPVLVGTAANDADDNHGAPSINIDADGYLHVMWDAWAVSVDPHPIQHATSTNPRDISAWTSTNLADGGMYPNLIVTSDGDLLLFHRSGTAGYVIPPEYGVIRRSVDGGATFDYTNIIDVTGATGTNWVYPMGATLAADGLHLTWIVLADVGGTETRQNIYHAVYDPVTGDLTNAAGTSLGSSIDWADHPSCIAVTVSPVAHARHTILDDGRIFIAYQTGTDNGDGTGTYTVRVATFDGTTWSTVDTGVPNTWTYASPMVVPWSDGVLGLFPTRTGSFTDLAAYTSPDGATWHDAGLLLEGDTGEGWETVGPVLGDGRWLGLTQQMATGWTMTSATTADLLPILGIEHLALNDTSSGTPATPADETVFAPAYTVTDGASLDVAVAFVWGIDSTGDPYYNAAGVTAGDEAVLVLDNSTGEFSLRPVEV